MHYKTVGALQSIADQHGFTLKITKGFVGFTQAKAGLHYEIHRHKDGRWIVAVYSSKHREWHSSDMPARFIRANPKFRYAMAPTIRGLIAYGVRTYATPAQAARSFFANF